MSLGGQPLPPHWEEAFDQKSGRSYFIDHVKKRTTWMDPRKWFDPNLPKTFSGNIISPLFVCKTLLIL